jgi:hypothetical protein
VRAGASAACYAMVQQRPPYLARGHPGHTVAVNVGEGISGKQQVCDAALQATVRDLGPDAVTLIHAARKQQSSSAAHSAERRSENSWAWLALWVRRHLRTRPQTSRSPHLCGEHDAVWGRSEPEVHVQDRDVSGDLWYLHCATPASAGVIPHGREGHSGALHLLLHPQRHKESTQ